MSGDDICFRRHVAITNGGICYASNISIGIDVGVVGYARRGRRGRRASRVRRARLLCPIAQSAPLPSVRVPVSFVEASRDPHVLQTLLNDKTTCCAMSKVTDNAPPPTLVEFLNTLPSPLTTALVGLAPYIARIRHWAQVVSWRSSWEDSWLALGLLWAVCLLAEFSLRCALIVVCADAGSSLTEKQIHPAHCCCSCIARSTISNET